MEDLLQREITIKMRQEDVNNISLALNISKGTSSYDLLNAAHFLVQRVANNDPKKMSEIFEAMNDFKPVPDMVVPKGVDLGLNVGSETKEK